MKPKKTILGWIIMFGTLPCFSQGSGLDSGLETGTTYQTAIGIRGGETSGLSIKYFLTNNQAIEGIVGVWRNGFSTTVLWEKYESAFNVDGLNWYYGAGGHASIGNGTVFVRYDNDRFYQYRRGGMGLGVDAIVGIEYAIPKIPFAVSLDLKPYAEIVTSGNLWLSIDPGVGIKLTF